MRTGWQEIGAYEYYFNSSGVMKTGWLDFYGTWYYFSSSGIMQKGWKEIGSKWYYFDRWGAMVTGQQYIGGKPYYFNDKGVWIKPLTDSQAKSKASDNWAKYKTQSQYLIDDINDLRADNYLYRLISDEKLSKSAMFRSSEMAHLNYLSAYRPDGSRFNTALDLYNVEYNYATQIVIETYGITGSDIYYLANWLYANYYYTVNSTSYYKIGVGVAKGSDGIYYWTIIFAY
jgi:hypothetical protein